MKAPSLLGARGGTAEVRKACFQGACILAGAGPWSGTLEQAPGRAQEGPRETGRGGTPLGS